MCRDHRRVGRISQGVKVIEGPDPEKINLVRVKRPGDVIFLIRSGDGGHGIIAPVNGLLDAEAVLIGSLVRPGERNV